MLARNSPAPIGAVAVSMYDLLLTLVLVVPLPTKAPSLTAPRS